MCTALLISDLHVKGIENAIRYRRILGNEENYAKESSMLKKLFYFFEQDRNESIYRFSLQM